MDVRVRELTCRYRLPPGPRAEPALRGRLDRLARGRVAEVLDESLDAVFGADPSVYVVRKLNARMAVGMDTARDDAALARRWGEHVAAAVSHSIAHVDDVHRVMRFPDEAVFVASFVRDLLDGRAWERWYYGAFARYRDVSPRRAIRAVLADHAGSRAQIFAQLDEWGALGGLLDALDDADLRALWGRDLVDTPARDSSLLPLFASAWALLRSLPDARLPDHRDALFRRYRERAATDPDWRDPKSLADAIFDALTFLAAALHTEGAEWLAARATALETALADARWDWIDRPRLVAHVRTAAQRGAGTGRPGARLPPLTPRLRSLLLALADGVTTRGLRVDPAKPARAALELEAALTASLPNASADPTTTALIERLVRGLAEVARCGDPGRVLDALRRSVGDAVALLPPELGDAQRDRIAFLAAALEAAPQLAACLDPADALRADGAARPDASTAVSSDVLPIFRSAAAGIFLLTRSVLDARLPALAAVTGFPDSDRERGLAGLLGALALRWAGLGAEEPLDPGIRLLAGVEESERIAAPFRTAGTLELQAFQSGLQETLAGHRLLETGAVRLHRLGLGDAGAALVLGDASGRLWVRGTVLRGGGGVDRIVEGWLDEWRAASGRSGFDVFADAEIAGPLPAHAQRIERLQAGAGEPSPEVAAHCESRDALAAAWATLDAGRLGLDDVDLTLTLAANALVRLWARWLPRFAGSSLAYLLDHFVRRPGTIAASDERIAIHLEPDPLDIVLEMAAYDADLERVAWLAGRSVGFGRS